MQGKWALVTVDVTPVQPQWVGCCHGGAKSNKQSRRVAAAVVVHCPIFCWQIKSPEPLNAVVLLDEHKIRGGRVSSPGPAPQGQLPRYIATGSPAQGAKGPGLALRVAKGEYCRVWREQAGRVGIAGPVLDSGRVCAGGRGAALTGGVLNAPKLTQDWPRGKAFPTVGRARRIAVPFTQSTVHPPLVQVCLLQVLYCAVSGLVRAALAQRLSL